MNIRFTSSLTPEDENNIAPAILTAMTAVLDLLPIAYAIRIDTTGAQLFQHFGRTVEAVEAIAQPAHPRSVIK